MYNGKKYQTQDHKTGDQIYLMQRKGDVVFGSYRGGNTRFGTLIGTLDKFLNLDFIYQEITKDNRMISGKGFIKPLTDSPEILNLYRTSSLRSNKKTKFLLHPIIK